MAIQAIQVIQNNGQLVVSSREVASNFGKDHRHVLEAIRNLQGSMSTAEFSALFYQSDYKASNGKTNPEYLMNRDGFSLLVMGFTGKEALEWKLKYINAFNMMEKRLSLDSYMIEDKVERALKWAEEQKVRLEQAKQIKKLTPKASAYDVFCDTDGLTGFREFCKQLGAKENMFRAFLARHNIMYHQGHWKAYKPIIQRGWMACKDVLDKSGRMFQAYMFTELGKSKIKAMWEAEQKQNLRELRETTATAKIYHI